ncbi:LytTR family transcriptional regulator DNA-binding domain-containing protein [Geobacter sp. DSM 9736]|uniref:LytTR family transcriptional regulator DNA-binding domain-containing protein n=1 Tax=Geobacter sp. DSM 9736 TaxID=1277350 RepID=UPI000B623143|nr:LytTR family transcriptional regulator DNA-binding domain-containing protein [Geobacter sp. DSM 9736]SNB47342.1 transcriptional regulator, LytTR family [Geobacter sp. DSM 9736]
MTGSELVNMIERVEPGVVLLDADYSISHINRMFMLMFSAIPRERLFESDILGFHREESRAKVAGKLRLAEEAQRQIPLSLKIINQDGQDRYLLIKITPLVDRNEAENRLCALFYDITPFISAERRLTRIPVTAGGEINLLSPEEIVYLKADNIYSRVYTENGEYHCDFSLGEITKRLPPEQFYRIHRSYVVSIPKIRKVRRETSECSVSIRENDVRLPISREKLQHFLVELGLK